MTRFQGKLDGNSVPTFGASPTQRLTSADGFHPGPETAHASPFALCAFKGAFHGRWMLLLAWFIIISINRGSTLLETGLNCKKSSKKLQPS